MINPIFILLFLYKTSLSWTNASKVNTTSVYTLILVKYLIIPKTPKMSLYFVYQVNQKDIFFSTLYLHRHEHLNSWNSSEKCLGNISMTSVVVSTAFPASRICRQNKCDVLYGYLIHTQNLKNTNKQSTLLLFLTCSKYSSINLTAKRRQRHKTHIVSYYKCLDGACIQRKTYGNCETDVQCQFTNFQW